jgi:hypothetical protein
MAKNGIKNTAPFFSGIKSATANAATITDHHGIKKEKRYAKIIVAIKLMIVLFIYAWY